MTLLGWTLMSSGREEKDGPALLTRSTSTDYEQLCALDVLGLADTHENDQQAVYNEFKEQLVRGEAGWYQTSLPWKGNHPPLPMNETGSKKLKKTFTVDFKAVDGGTTKRDVLSQIAKVYDPLGLVSPTTLTAKLLFRDICDAKLSWDSELPQPLLKRCC